MYFLSTSIRLRIKLLLGHLLFVCLMLAGCIRDKSTHSDESQPPQEALHTEVQYSQPEALHNMDTNAVRIGNNAYDFSALVPLFPDIIAGASRQSAHGENFKMAEDVISSATASYSVRDRRFSVSIQDVGDTPGLIPQLAKWHTTSIALDDEIEIQRSGTFLNQPAFIQYNKSSRSGTYSVIYFSRFVVDIAGRNVELADLEKAMEDLRIDRLK